MALAADSVIEVQIGGSDTNGGGFSVSNAGATGVDLTQGAATALTVTTTASTTVTATVGSFLNTMLGNYINIASDGVYMITVFTNSTTVTVDRATGTAVGASAKVGGPLLTIGFAGGTHVAGNTVWVKYNATNFTATNSTSNVINGRFSLKAGVVTAPTVLRGYETTRGDETSNRPTFAWGANGTTNYLISGGNFTSLENIIIDGKSASFTGRGVNGAATPFYMRRVKILGCTTGPFDGSTGISFGEDIEITANSAVASITSGRLMLRGSYIHDNLVGGFTLTTGQISAHSTIFDTNAGDHVNMSGAGRVQFDNCIFYNATGTFSGVTFQVAAEGIFVNTHFESNTAYGINFAAACPLLYMLNCSFYNNTTLKYTANSVLAQNIVSEVIPTGSVFLDGPNQNFALNNTASAGTVLRAVGYPRSYPGSATTNYLDVGGAQHQDSGTTIFSIED